MLPKSPCLDCTERKHKCHGTCQRGQEYREALRKRNNQIKEAKLKEQDINSFKYQQVTKVKKEMAR